MEITKEYLEREIQQLTQAVANAMAVLNKTQGALIYCQTMLQELETPVIEEEDLEIVEDEEAGAYVEPVEDEDETETKV